MDRKEWAALRSLLAMFPKTVYGQTLPGPSSLRGRESPLWKTPEGKGGEFQRGGGNGLGLSRLTFPSPAGCYLGSGKGPDCISQGLLAGPLH